MDYASLKETVIAQSIVYYIKTIKGKNLTSKPYTYPVSEKDEQTAEFFLQYEKTSEVVNWNSFELKAEEKKTIEQHIDDLKNLQQNMVEFLQKI